MKIGVIVALLMGPILAWSQTTLTGKALPQPKLTDNSLFYLQRTKNTNTVVYDAVPEAQGKLNAKKPIDAYWLHYESEGGKRADLSTFEQMAVYGVDYEEIKDGRGSYLMRLKAFKDRAVTVSRNEVGKFVGFMNINGKKAILKRIYIEAKEGLISPTVLWVDLFGIDPATGQAVTERIRPK